MIKQSALLLAALLGAGALLWGQEAGGGDARPVAAEASPAATSAPAATPAPSAATAAGTAAPAGDEAAGTETRTLVVTASRTETDSQTVASSVTVISAADIAASGAVTLPEVLQRLGGVAFLGLSSPADAQVTLRGFGENAFGRVLVLVDGLRLNNPDMKGLNWLGLSLDAIERIEVLRGPASSLYGDAAVAGVVNIITRKAGQASRARARVSLGTDWSNTEALDFFHQGKDLSFGLTALNAGSEGWRERSAWQNAAVDARLAANLAQNFSLDLAAHFADRSYQMPGTISYVQFLADPTVAANLADEAAEQNLGADLSLVWDPAEVLSLSLPANYRYATIDSDMVSWTSYQTRQTNTVEARPQASLDLDLGGAGLAVQGGLDFRFVDLSWTNYSGLARDTALGSRQVQQTVAAPWAQARLSLADLLYVQAGARYDTAHYSLNGAASDLSALVWDASLNLVPVPEFKVWAGVDRVFRYPFTDELASVYSSTVWDLEPETGYNLEAGLGLRLGQGALDVQAGFYWLTLENEIAWVNDFANTTDWGYNTNLEATERLGFDLSLETAPLDWLSARASYSFVDARFAAGANAGLELPLVSAHRVGGGVEFHLPFGLSFGPDVSYVSDYLAGSYYSAGSTPADGEREPGYFLLGAGLDWTIPSDAGEFDLLVRADNLLNVSYYAVAYSYGVYPARGISLDVVLNWKY